jgi:hypothetical protein
VDECKPLDVGTKFFFTVDFRHVRETSIDGGSFPSEFINVESLPGRGLHSSTFQLNLSRF